MERARVAFVHISSLAHTPAHAADKRIDLSPHTKCIVVDVARVTLFSFFWDATKNTNSRKNRKKNIRTPIGKRGQV